MSKHKNMRPIPIGAAEHIGKAYGYEQVVIYARRTGEGGEHDDTGSQPRALQRRSAHGPQAQGVHGLG